MSKNLKTQWRVQVRKSRAHKWVNKGLFETRDAARDEASYQRTSVIAGYDHIGEYFGYGFGNTRVVKYIKA